MRYSPILYAKSLFEILEGSKPSVHDSILKNLTMRELVGAAGLDITEATMWGIESGDQRMSAFQLLRLASVLGMSVDKIFSEVTTLYSPKIEFFDQSNNKSEKF